MRFQTTEGSRSRMVKDGRLCRDDRSTLGFISVPGRVLLPNKKYGRVDPSVDTTISNLPLDKVIRAIY